MGRSQKRIGRFGEFAKRASAGLAVAAAGGAAYAFKEARDAEKVGRQTTAVLKSTGNAARVSKSDVESLAEAISVKVGVDDEAIQSAENMLLTFKNVRREVGRGNDIFGRGTKAAVDLSAAFDKDLRSSTVMVGKALNDPIKGITALNRVGVTFTQQQKDQVTAMVESGRTLDAQKFILRELESQVKGSGAAQADEMDRAKVAVDNLAESIGTSFAPHIQKGAGELAEFVTEIRTGRGEGGEFANTVKQIWTDAKPIVVWFGKAAAGVGKFAAAHPEVTKLATAVGLAGLAFNKFKVGGAIKGVGTFVDVLRGAGRRGGTALATNAADAAAGSIGAQVNGRSGKFASAGRGAGRAMGAAAGTATSTVAANTAASSIGGSLGTKKGKFRAAGRPVGRALGVGVVAGTVVGLAGLGGVVTEALRKVRKDKVEPWIENNFGEAGSVYNDVVGFLGKNFGRALNNPTLEHLFKDNRKGGWATFGDGGMVPSILSPGEVGILPNGSSFTVPGARVAADTYPMMLPQGTAVLTDHGQQLAAMGWPLNSVIANQAPHFRDGGLVGATKGAASLIKAGVKDPRQLVVMTATGGRETGGTYDPKTRSLKPNVNGTIDHGWLQINDIWGKDPVGRRYWDERYTFEGGSKLGKRVATKQGPSAWRLSGWNVDSTISKYMGTAQKAVKRAMAGKGFSYSKVTQPKITHPLLQSMLQPLTDDALLGGIEAGREGTARWRLVQETLEGIVPEADDRPTRERVSVSGSHGRGARASGPVAARIARGKAWLDNVTSKGLGYQYGGGHGAIGKGSPSFDCSGLVSGGLGAMGVLSSPLDTVGLMSWGKPGKGRNVTVGIRGGAGKTGHTMMEVLGQHYESSSAGVGKRSGWSGTFTTWRHPAFRQGGVVGGKRMLPPSPEGARHLKALAARKQTTVASLLDPQSKVFVGWGMANPRKPKKKKVTVARLVKQLGGSPGTAGADKLTRQLSGKVKGRNMSALLRGQRIAQKRIRSMSKKGFTGSERIKTRRLRGALSLLQDEMGRPIGRELGITDRVQERIAARADRLEDELVVSGIDPESDEGIAAQRDLSTKSLAQLDARRKKLNKQLARAKKTGNKKAVQAVQAEIREVDREQLSLRRSIIDLTKAMNDNTDELDAIRELTEQTKALKEEMEKGRKFADGISAIGVREAIRFMVDMLSGQVAADYSQRSQSPGDGALTRY